MSSSLTNQACCLRKKNRQQGIRRIRKRGRALIPAVATRRYYHNDQPKLYIGFLPRIYKEQSQSIDSCGSSETICGSHGLQQGPSIFVDDTSRQCFTIKTINEQFKLKVYASADINDGLIATARPSKASICSYACFIALNKTSNGKLRTEQRKHFICI